MVVCSFLDPLRPFLDCGLAVVDPAFRLEPAEPFFSGFSWFCDEAGLELFAAAAACRAEDLVPAIVVYSEGVTRAEGMR